MQLFSLIKDSAGAIDGDYYLVVTKELLTNRN